MLPGTTLRSQLRDRGADRARVRGDRGAGHLMIGMIGTLAADIDMLNPPRRSRSPTASTRS